MGRPAWDNALDQCHYWCREMVITTRQIYCLGQSKLLSLPPALAAEGFNLSPMSCLFSCLGPSYGITRTFFFFWRRGSMMIDTLEILSPWMMQSSNWRLKIPKTNKKHPLLCNGLPIICSNPFTLTKYFLKTIMSASVPTIPFIIIHTNFIWIFFQIKWGDRAPKLAHSDQKPSLKFPIFYISMVDVQKKDLPVIIFSKGSMTSNDGNKLSNRNIVLNRKWGACSLAPPENSGTSSSPYNQLLLRSENLNL